MKYSEKKRMTSGVEIMLTEFLSLSLLGMAHVKLAKRNLTRLNAARNNLGNQAGFLQKYFLPSESYRDTHSQAKC